MPISDLAIPKHVPYSPLHETVLSTSRRVLRRRFSLYPDLDGGGELEDDRGGGPASVQVRQSEKPVDGCSQIW